MTVGLKISNLTGGYADTRVIFDLDAGVEGGEILGVFGRNGVGKTTLARLAQGGLRPAAGQISINGREVGPLAACHRRQLGLGYMPQTQMVFDDLTVRQNLELGDNSLELEPYFEIFPRLHERLDQNAGSMSGGERKILAFVRTMVEDTNILILDEPSEGVQPENIERMASCLKKRAKMGAAIILIEQNITFLCDVCDKFLGLDAGKVTLNAPKDDLIEEKVRALLAI